MYIHMHRYVHTPFWISGGLYENSLFVGVTTTSLRWKVRDIFKFFLALHMKSALRVVDLLWCLFLASLWGAHVFSFPFFQGPPGFKGSDGYLGEEGTAVSHDLLPLSYSYKPKKGNKDQSEGSDAASLVSPEPPCSWVASLLVGYDHTSLLWLTLLHCTVSWVWKVTSSPSTPHPCHMSRPFCKN